MMMKTANMIIRTPLLPLILAIVGFSATPAIGAGSEEQCFGLDPQPSIVNYLGATLDYEVADRICCHNHHFAEYKGYLAAPEVDLFGRLDPNVETTFYDSVCGIPLFVAPRNRTFEEFKAESLKHGWPSFRPAEIVSENVIIHDDGRMESKCLTHLGHNLPSGGADRYCIDLVCIAGAPLPNSELQNLFPGVVGSSGSESGSKSTESSSEAPAIISADDFNATSYVSSAEQNSGKHNKISTFNIVLITALVVLLIIALGCLFMRLRKRRDNGSEEKATMTKNNGEVESGDGGETSSNQSNNTD